MSDTPLLSIAGVSKRFGSVQALDAVDLEILPGTVHAVLGENGAGKTTLMRVAYGMITPDKGVITIRGTAHTLRSPRDAIGAGVGMVHQHFSNVPSLTVAENVALGERGPFNLKNTAQRIVQAALAAGLPLDPNARVEDLPVSAQQRLEILKALVSDARILILDEPTAVLAPSEAAELLAWLRRFADAGGAVILVTHKVREALAVADHLTVLRQGRVVVSGPAKNFAEASLAQAMFPNAPTEQPPHAALANGSTQHRVPTVLATDATLADEGGQLRITKASFAIYPGEIVGVAAVEGAGHTALLQGLAGLGHLVRGELRVPPTVGFIPEDRQRDALVLDFTLAENLALQGSGARRGILHWKQFTQRTRVLLEVFGVHAHSEQVPVRTLSGGNQQRFVLARTLESEPALVVAENPTRGLDLQATIAIRSRLRTVASRGAAVVIYSSDVDEVLLLASRVLVVHAGTVREMPSDRELIGRAMLGAA